MFLWINLITRRLFCFIVSIFSPLETQIICSGANPSAQMTTEGRESITSLEKGNLDYFDLVPQAQTQITWKTAFWEKILSHEPGVKKRRRLRRSPISCFFKSSKADQWKPHCCWGLRFVLFVSAMPVNADSSWVATIYREQALQPISRVNCSSIGRPLSLRSAVNRAALRLKTPSSRTHSGWEEHREPAGTEPLYACQEFTSALVLPGIVYLNGAN